MLDSRLKFLREAASSRPQLESLEGTGRFGVSIESETETLVRVLVQASEPADEQALANAGLRITSRGGDVYAGEISLTNLEKLDQLDGVVLVESSRPMSAELDASLPEIRANLVHTGPPGRRGAGVIVGVIDSGIDWRHQSFRNALGQTRILRIWDQNLTPQTGESSPAPFGYGVEYNQTRINNALANANPLSIVRHMDDSIGHGTHVAGIAAGDGSIGGGTTTTSTQAAFTFVGVAPEADLIVVANRVTTEALGDSASTLDAIQYIFNVAQSLGRPCVINLSQGDNLGPHDGTSLLERGIDNLLGGQGRAMVKSAGNAADAGIHASGTIGSAGASVNLTLQFPAGANPSDTVDIWYAGADRFSVRITPPGGAASATVAAGNSATLNFANGNRVFVDSVVNHPNNGDNRIYLQFQNGTAGSIQSGTWTIRLTGVTVVNGGFHAWIERGNVVPQFTGALRNDAVTISVPGTAREVITAASYITKGSGVGSLSTFSSRGPTRDGRAAPTIAAPGQAIVSARVNASGNQQYLSMSGTSMAAPHVTGVIALMFQANPNLTQPAIINCLTANARSDAFTGAVPNTNWGSGKINAQAAVNCAAPSLPFTTLTLFTRFTGLTLFTSLTRFTALTRFTPFTSLTRFTGLTTFTSLTRFTPFTPITIFTPFTFGPTRFIPFSRFPIPGPDPFIRFRNVLIDPADLALEQHAELESVAPALGAHGISRIDQLVTRDYRELAAELGIDEEQAAQLVQFAQDLLRRFAG